VQRPESISRAVTCREASDDKRYPAQRRVERSGSQPAAPLHPRSLLRARDVPLEGRMAGHDRRC
jgi:hypothetical protein